MDWSLLGCGRSGHVTYAPDEPGVRAQLSATTAAGEAWRCLRCASYVAGPAGSSGPAARAPRVRRGLQIRSLLILRIFSVERFLRALLFFGLAVLLWQFKHSQHSIEAAFDRERPILRELFRQLGFNIDHSKLVGLIQHALTLSSSAITLLAIGLAAYAAIEVVEGVGLWLARRWGEYFAMVATSLGLPLEIYDLAHKVTVTALIFLAVNLALVVYLVATKRLFGVRGGKHAYESRLRSDSVMEQAIEAAAVASDGTEVPAHSGVTPPAAASGSPAATPAGAPTAPGAPSSTQEAPATSAPPGGTGPAGIATDGMGADGMSADGMSADPADTGLDPAAADGTSTDEAGMYGTGTNEAGADEMGRNAAAAGTDSAGDARSAEPVGRHRATPAASTRPAPDQRP
jgi:uncharacterized membrane protein (DUF2068 family)